MGKLTISLVLAGLLVLSEAHVGGLLPQVLVLLGMIAYSVAARQHVTLNADPQEVREARARVAANAVPCDWVRPD